jgi:serine/threonine-protein kinase
MIGTSRIQRLGVLAILSSVASVARAQSEPPRDPIGAETLFTRGKQLMEQGKIGEACSAFAESQRLDPAGGTLTRLALCHEAQGKLASAWLEFTEVVRVSKETAGEPTKFTERVRIAHEHLAALEPRLSKLVVIVPSEARVDGLRVTANGLPRNEGSWGVAIPVDSGEVEVVALAPGRQTFKTTVHADEGKQASIAIPVLEPEPTGPLPEALHETAAATAPPASSPLRPIAFAVGGAGLVAIGVGSYFGITAVSKWSDSNKQCSGSMCTAQGVSLAHDAKQAAVISDVTIGLGLAAVAAGVILYFVGAPKNVQASAQGVGVLF